MHKIMTANRPFTTAAIACASPMLSPTYNELEYMRTPLEWLRNYYRRDTEALSLLEQAQIIYLLSKARHQIDVTHSMIAAVKDAGETVEEKREACLKKTPIYLHQRITADVPLPVAVLRDPRVGLGRGGAKEE